MALNCFLTTIHKMGNCLGTQKDDEDESIIESITHHKSREGSRGSIAFSATYRPLVPLDLHSCPIPPVSYADEDHITDGVSYNYTAQQIPPAALKRILEHTKLGTEASGADVDDGRVSGLVFVSERTQGLETLHIGLCFHGGGGEGEGQDGFKAFCLADVYSLFDGSRLEDSGCVAGDYFVYVSTKDPAPKSRQPWTAVYKTHLETGLTHRLTPLGEADMSPAASPNGKMIAVASFEKRGGWDGEIEYQKTDIFIMNTDGPLDRKLVIEDGGWPSWGTDTVIFFHRLVPNVGWSVFRADISDGGGFDTVQRVTPVGVDAITPCAIDATTVVVVTIRNKPDSHSDGREEHHYRHVEIFDSTGNQEPVQITQKIKSKADFYNPFVIVLPNGEKRIGYHRSKCELLQGGSDGQTPKRPLDNIHSPHVDVDVFRVSGVFPTFSRDGSKLAFVDNEFKEVFIANKKGCCIIHKEEKCDSIFSPVWNQNSEKHILYVCKGPSFKSRATVDICAIDTSGAIPIQKLTDGFNNAFPSTNPDGTRLVFRSTRDGGDKNYKNLYIMENAEQGLKGKITRLTNGPWIDTHCEWSPRGDWIVFSSTRDKPEDAPELNNAGLDSGHFAAYIVKADDPSVIVRVIGSGDGFAGHVNHPFFSPDMRNIVITSDLAAVSCDPISLPHFMHSVRPYGDIFMIDVDPDNIDNNRDVKDFQRITHSKYENGIATWTFHSHEHSTTSWANFIHALAKPSASLCPFLHHDGGHGWNMTGHVLIPGRVC